MMPGLHLYEWSVARERQGDLSHEIAAYRLMTTARAANASSSRKSRAGAAICAVGRVLLDALAKSSVQCPGPTPHRFRDGLM
jgi:hypothetical protein